MTNKSAVDIIKDNLDVREVLEHYKVKGITESGNFIRCSCPLHGGDNETAFSINVETSLWRCFTGDCGGGDIFTLIEKKEKLEFPGAVNKLANILNIDINGVEIVQRKSSHQKEIEEWMRYIEKKRKKSNEKIEEFIVKEEILPLKKYRHFTEETLFHFKAGFIKKMEYKNSKGEMSTTYDRILCPIYVSNTQIGVSLRKTKAKELVKWLHLPTGVGVGNIIYNLDACENYDTIVIVEGIFDVWAYHQAGIENTVCVFGSKLTDEQYKILFRTGKDLILSFDGDEAGRKATKQVVELFKYKALLYVVKFEEGADPSSITSEELKKLYNLKEKIKC